MIYADAAATTPLKKQVQEAMNEVVGLFGNSHSLHMAGKLAEKKENEAKKVMAEALGVHVGQIIITQGGSDANARVISMIQRLHGLDSVWASALEHSSVKHLVNKANFYDPFTQNYPDNAKLVCQMFANNETGVILPKLTPKKGEVVLQDWVQGAGKAKLSDLQTDFVSVSAHKFGGPKNAGLLIIKDPKRWPELFNDNRTTNLSLIVGMAEAMKTINDEKKHKKLQKLTERFEKAFADEDRYKIHHKNEARVPGITSLAIKNVRGSKIMAKLSQEEEICVSTGSACNRDVLSVTPVIQFIEEKAEWQYPIRVSWHESSTEKDVEEVAEAIKYYEKQV